MQWVVRCPGQDVCMCICFHAICMFFLCSFLFVLCNNIFLQLHMFFFEGFYVLFFQFHMFSFSDFIFILYLSNFICFIFPIKKFFICYFFLLFHKMLSSHSMLQYGAEIGMWDVGCRMWDVGCRMWDAGML